MAVGDPPPPRRQRVRISDVAAGAGVSRTTASDALNGRGRVDGDTRARVLATAKAMGYRVNAHARMLRRGRSGVLGVISSLTQDRSVDLSGVEYFVDILASTATTALTHGYAVVVLPLTLDPDTLDPLYGDGMLLLDPMAGGALVDRLEGSGVPTVSTGRVPDRPRDAGTWVDNDIGAEVRRMLDLLHERGARRVALVTNPAVRSYALDTVEAYEDWARATGQEPRIALTRGPASESSGYESALALLAGAEPPDAIYAPLDRLAVGAMLAARSRGLTTPGDILIAAGSDSQAARSADPPVTALGLNARQIGQRAIELLIERVEGRLDEPCQAIVPATLHERASTLRIPDRDAASHRRRVRP